MKTHVQHARDAGFDQGLRQYFAYRDLGYAGATAGKFGVNVIRAVPGEHPHGAWHIHELDFQFVYVLKGWVEFEYEDVGFVRLEAGSTVMQPVTSPRPKYCTSTLPSFSSASFWSARYIGAPA